MTMVERAAAGHFAQDDLVRLRAQAEVEIETRADMGEPAHRTVIWVVVDRRDRVLIRSYRGSGARWYREAVGHPVARLLFEGGALDVRVQQADDGERIAACSEELLRKYADDPATLRMVADAVLRTTLELLPA
jgi:hypothetical protein